MPRYLLFLSGCAAAASLAPFYAWPLLFVSLPMLLHALHTAANPRQAFWRGWWWGVGFCIAGLYWIVIALTIDMARFGWMIPFALIGLCGSLALFYAVIGWLYAKAKRPHPITNWVLFALIFSTIEWARGHIFTGFPWNLLGYSWGFSDASAQAASLLGIYGLSLLTVAVASSAWLFRSVGRKQAGVVLAACGLLVAGLTGWGAWRLQGAVTEPSGVVVRMVQANISQKLKWDGGYLQTALQEHIDLSQAASDETPDLILWPETAFPFALSKDSEWPSELAKILKPSQLLVTGAVIAEEKGEQRNIYNGMVAINEEGNIVTNYAKHHLVPFGEYLPLRDWLSGSFTKLTAGAVDFSRGQRLDDGLKLAKNISILPLICYEVIFPAYGFHQTHRGFMLNLTNDAWYGNSSGPYQHRDAARFRAIEQGLPMVRVAGTGISVAYDGYGRELASIPLNQKGVADVHIPAPTPTKTLYSRIEFINIY